MADYKYTKVTGKIPDLLNKIRNTGVPPKADTKWLKAIGFTSSNDVSLKNILQFIDFVNSDGTPTDRWQKFRSTNYKKVLGNAIKDSYSELYLLYQDAYERNDDELENFFRTHTTAGAQVVKALVSTFKALTAEAEFDDKKNLGIDSKAVKPPKPATSVGKKNDPKKDESTSDSKGGFKPKVHIDIQIHISPESSADQIDNIFKSMAKHLYKSDE